MTQPENETRIRHQIDSQRKQTDGARARLAASLAKGNPLHPCHVRDLLRLQATADLWDRVIARQDWELRHPEAGDPATLHSALRHVRAEVFRQTFTYGLDRSADEIDTAVIHYELEAAMRFVTYTEELAGDHLLPGRELRRLPTTQPDAREGV